MTELQALEEAIAYFQRQSKRKNGGKKLMAEFLGVPKASISQWISRGRMPAHHVPNLSRETGVARKRLRPDIYGAGDR